MVQDIFQDDPPLRAAFLNSLSPARFQPYKMAANNDELLGIAFYKWNLELGQSLWPSLQAWEVCLRNKLNNFLCWKYLPHWPYDETRALRQLKANDRRKVHEARERQQQAFKLSQAPTSAIVADIAAGFWVSLLSGAYDIPFQWRSNLRRIFPHDRSLVRQDAWTRCDDMLDLRNRIAHHEPILGMRLPELHERLGQTVAAMCAGTAAYCGTVCKFDSVWSARPKRVTQAA